MDTKVYLREIANSYLESGSLGEPTLTLAVKNGWRIAFQQVYSKSWNRYEYYKGCITAAAALRSGCLRADLTRDFEHCFVELFDPAIAQGIVEPGPLVDDSDGIKFAEWDVALLALLPKKGDLSLGKNWRGICLLDVASKIFSSMLVRHMQTVMEEDGIQSTAWDNRWALCEKYGTAETQRE